MLNYKLKGMLFDVYNWNKEKPFDYGELVAKEISLLEASKWLRRGYSPGLSLESVNKYNDNPEKYETSIDELMEI